MQDRPTAPELLEAIEEFLRERSKNEPDRFYGFQFLVAANSLAILRREWELEEANLAAEWARLDTLLGPSPRPATAIETRRALLARTDALCDQIRAGAFDHEPAETSLLEHLITTSREKLRITSPQQAEEPA